MKPMIRYLVALMSVALVAGVVPASASDAPAADKVLHATSTPLLLVRPAVD